MSVLQITEVVVECWLDLLPITLIFFLVLKFVCDPTEVEVFFCDDPTEVEVHFVTHRGPFSLIRKDQFHDPL